MPEKFLILQTEKGRRSVAGFGSLGRRHRIGARFRYGIRFEAHHGIGRRFNRRTFLHGILDNEVLEIGSSDRSDHLGSRLRLPCCGNGRLRGLDRLGRNRFRDRFRGLDSLGWNRLRSRFRGLDNLGWNRLRSRFRGLDGGHRRLRLHENRTRRFIQTGNILQ